MKKTKQIEKNAKIVNKHLNSKLKGNPKKLYDAAGHLIIHGGKRLRPYMVIRSCQILGGKVSNAMPAASAVTLLWFMMISWTMMRCVMEFQLYIKNLECQLQF
jgi:geranylgeranyl diphosphate synthase type I